MNFTRHFFEVLFPEKCVGCGSRGTLLCDECRKKIAPASNPMHSWITSVFAYNDFRVKRLIWLLKYKNNRRVAKLFAPQLAAALEEFLGEEKIFHGDRTILLIPIPLSKKRLAKREYNQAELLAKEIADNILQKNIVIETKLIKKIRETTPQADIKKRQTRLENLGDCFEATRSASGGEIIILIDDVTTTGATLTAARKALRAAGFRKIYALTVAH